MNRSIFQIWKQTGILCNLNKSNFSKKDKNDLTLFESQSSLNYSFLKPNNLKEIFNAWDVFINWSINSGNSHIAFTINFPKGDENITHFTNKLKLHPIVADSKEYKDFIDDLHLLFHDHYTFYHYFADISLYNRLITWKYCTTEENENGVLHLHGIIAYRNLMDYNKNISHNLLNLLKGQDKSCDIVLKDLNNFKDIKGWVRYLHVNKVLVFAPKFDIIYKYIDFLLNIFDKSYLENYNLHNNSKIEIDDIRKEIHLVITPLDCFFEQSSKFLNLSGIVLKSNEISEKRFIDLILNYLILNSYYIFNENIYEKIGNFLISYKKLGSIKEILFDNFNNIILYFTENFPCQFQGFNFYYLVTNFKNKMENSIINIKNLTTNKIVLDFSYLEFLDGVYDIKNDRFFIKRLFFKKNIATIKYYNKHYSYVRQIKPIEWINGLKNALGKNNSEDFIVICCFIASIFQIKDENIKRNFLYIHGKTNTGKSTYLTKVIMKYFGPENIGSVINSLNFKFQDIDKKLFVIIDEFKYNSSSSGDYLKLTGSEPLLVPQKFSKDHIIIDKLMGLILSNNLFIEKNESIKKALFERLHVIEFLNEVIKNDTDINKTLNGEEANIIIFCNKLYFSYINAKRTRKRENSVEIIK